LDFLVDENEEIRWHSSRVCGLPILRRRGSYERQPEERLKEASDKSHTVSLKQKQSDHQILKQK